MSGSAGYASYCFADEVDSLKQHGLMTNNDILRRIRYTFDLGDSKMMAIFAQVDYEVSREQVSDWLKKEDDPKYRKYNRPLPTP